MRFMRPSVRQIAFFSYLMIACVAAAPAEEKSGEVAADNASPGVLVVTATRRRIQAEDAPSWVDVVPSADMEARNLKSVDQALNSLPGVFVRRGKGLMDTQSGISMHGIPDQKRTLLLLDGMPINDAYDASVKMGGLPAEFFDTVEAAHGPASSLYGGNAMGGAIQLLTRTPMGKEATLKVGYGSAGERGTAMNDMKRVVATLGDRFDNGLALFGAFSEQSTGGYASDFNVSGTKPPATVTGSQPTTSTTGAANYLLGDKGDNRWFDRNALFKLEQALSGIDRLRVSWLHTEYRYGYDSPQTLLRNVATGAEVWKYVNATTTVRESSFLNGAGAQTRDFIQTAFEGEMGGGELKLSLGNQDVGSNWYVTPNGTNATCDGGPGIVSSTPNMATTAEAQWSKPLDAGHLMTLGTSLRRDEAHTTENNLTDWRNESSKTTVASESFGRSRTIGLFAQDEWRLATAWTAFLGLRYDRWTNYDAYEVRVGTAGFPKSYDARSDSASSPKAALVWKQSAATSWKVSLGKAFRPPSIYDLYRTWSLAGTTYNANPNLTPETLTSWDFGVDTALWAGSRLKASYFENSIKDLIYTVGTGSTRNRANVGRAFGRGIESRLEQQMGGGFLFASLTLNDAKIAAHSADPTIVGKKLQQLPDRMASTGYQGKSGPWGVYAAGRYVDKRWGTDANTDSASGVKGVYDAYFVADARVSYSFSHSTKVSFAIDNVFDRRYFDSYVAPGRNWFVELALSY
ncbi:MAG: TonB-dependent receptor [Pseudomonadota bacterium]